jgi:Icc-related predicted phosphoesterase
MTDCLFVSDLHGKLDRYDKLLRITGLEQPQALFIGGDLLPPALQPAGSRQPWYQDFVEDYLCKAFKELRQEMGTAYPRVFVILGNDDGRLPEVSLIKGQDHGLWEYIHMRKADLFQFQVYGYSYVPPTPFFLKDWERYDVSRYVDPGCISPEEGQHSVPVDPGEVRNATIKDDLDRLAGDGDLDKAVFLFHTPPYGTDLDRAALDGKRIEHVPLDPHLGSIAVRRFIESRQPLLTLHGHVHESSRLTGAWGARLGKTFAFSAAHHGPELAVIRFQLEDLASATRALL